MASCSVCCYKPTILAISIGGWSFVPQRRAESDTVSVPRRGVPGARAVKSSPITYSRAFCVPTRASMVDSYESSSNFAKRTEQAWLISQQPRPIGCSSCHSNGHVECKWCAGTGFFILGDNMLCQVPSRNTSCVICCGKGSTCCSDCKGTGFRAVWLEKPPISK